MGDWFRSLWNAATWWASDWFAGPSGGTIPPATGSGGGVHHGRPRPNPWAEILRRVRVRRRHVARGRSAISPATGAGHGAHHRRHAATGTTAARSATGNGRASRHSVGLGVVHTAPITATTRTGYTDDAADLLLLAEIALENW